MAEPEWKKMNASPEKFLRAENYLTKPFSGILEAMYPDETQGQKPVPLIRLDFKGGSSLSIFGLDNRNEDGTYPFGLGAFIKSAEALGLEVQEAELDGVVQGVRLLEGGTLLENPKLWIRGIEEKKIGEITQVFHKWGVLEKYEATAPAAPIKKPGKYPPKARTKEPEPAPSNELIDKLIEESVEGGVEGQNISDVFANTFKKQYKVGELRAALKEIGFEVKDGIIQKTA